MCEQLISPKILSTKNLNKKSLKMPGCAAIGCNNRSEKGYTMKCFPRDPILRQIWKDRVGRADWEPSNNSFLCHAHFAPNQWMVTQCGRLKLRKGAVPSIFRVVSTRKSPNKRRRLGIVGRSEDEEFGIEIVDDDEENYIYVETPDMGRIQNIGDESIVFLDSQNSPILANLKGKDGQSMNNVYQIISNNSLNNLQHENVLVISDESNNEIGQFVHSNDKYIIINNENEDTNNQIQPIEIVTNQIPHNQRIKVEVKDEGHATADEIYDEVESNMERIYEGINSDDESTSQKSSRLNKKLEQIEVLQRRDFILNGKNVDNDVKSMLRNSRSDDSDEIIVNVDDIEDEDEDDIDIENTSTKGTEELPNFEAALQRKKKAREETMKSIERFISDSVNESTENDVTEANSSKSTNGKFNIKFTEEIEDISDIMRDLGEKPTEKCPIEINYQKRPVIRMERTLQKIIKTERMSNYDSEETITDQIITIPQKLQLKTEHSEFMIVADSDFINEQNENVDIQITNKQKKDTKRGIKRKCTSDSEEKLDPSDPQYTLKLKLQQQKNTIAKLTDHMSAYKDMENKMQEINDELKLKNREIVILSAKLNRKDNIDERSDRNFAALHALIKDLTQKVKTIEDVNRRLSRTISVENQSKKSLEYQIRGRDKLIKELNWKVDKASKLLERAERNANNYKRRVNNMRSLLKRKNFDLVHDKQSSFDVLFADYVKHEFSEKSLEMACEIRKLCGSNGYEKLLGYNFPLPSLRTIKRRISRPLNENGGNKSNIDTNFFNAIGLNSSDLKNIQAVMKTPENSVTVTGTVQDIFNEDDNIEDMSETEVMSEMELKEHLFNFMHVK
ncbi:MATH and LRR domain-containing protein PFE0570w-like [Leptopilina boulardi]|uniref:MATH and LRR domain-containing protein PFE0570w-like n=1 Tax=Leptopilina boulardi TaxID=63433 RepID=UPI0021F56CE2|nr:MATH and LRR domain-containing protein PFE0570w-like [Leptopilina boulardi]XP_051164485.1 MATH and LRR domain-containing protein PFE0570w-like [Leptopilina boulardi]XP_051164486.1 MATH and LRR domain-containing protein PFE0570w-like [Leptopilina boulardi]